MPWLYPILNQYDQRLSIFILHLPYRKLALPAVHRLSILNCAQKPPAQGKNVTVLLCRLVLATGRYRFFILLFIDAHSIGLQYLQSSLVLPFIFNKVLSLQFPILPGSRTQSVYLWRGSIWHLNRFSFMLSLHASHAAIAILYVDV